MAVGTAYTLTRAQYLTDFLFTPAMVVAVGAFALWALPWAALGAAIVGFVAWIFSEYVTHRYVFHRLYRREHWAHHMRPASDIGISPIYTIPGQVLLAIAGVWAMGMAIGGGLFAGYAIGYLTYLTVHHAFHRWSIGSGHWLRAAYERHELHHAGIEKNFNVLIPLGDKLFKTFEQPMPGLIA